VHVPFYHQFGHGLYLTERRLRWAVLRQSGSTVDLHQVYEEEVRGRPVEEALRALLGRIEPEPKAVSTHLPPEQVRHFSAERSEKRGQRRWMEETAQSHLPAGVPLEDFVVRARLLSEPEGGPAPSRPGRSPKYLIALARREAIEKHQRLCQSVGLELLAVGDLRTALCFAYAFDPAFTDGKSPTVLVHDGAAWLLSHKNGRLSEPPRQLRKAREGETRREPFGREALENAVYRLAGDEPSEAPSHLFVAGEGAAETVDASAESLPMGAVLRPTPPSFRKDASSARAAEKHSRSENREGEDKGTAFLSPGVTPALACAVQSLYPRSDEINFLEEEEVRGARDGEDRRNAVRAGLLVGGALAALLLLTTGLNAYFSAQARRASAQLKQIDQRLAQVERARRQRDRLRDRLEQSQVLVTGRTRSALILEQVGQAVSQDAWLDKVNLASAHGDSVSVQASGFARQQAGIATLLSQLEKRSVFQGIRLAYSEILPAETVEEKTGRYRQRLHRFGVRLWRVSKARSVPKSLE
jgi:Tfp pilus assembly protein PilN